jgi:S-adenosylmethionine hydrolase
VADFDVEAAAHLLASLIRQYPEKSVFLAVVDPGVGGKRDAIVVQAEGQSFVGPDNGLFSLVWQRARRRKCLRIDWRPQRLSSSFHGRDLFAPVAAAMAARRIPRRWLSPKHKPEVLLPASELPRVIYVDHYGNAMTGLRQFKKSWRLRAGGRSLAYARTFEDADAPFWYENNIGLVEIAVPRASAARLLRLTIGSAVAWQRSTP